MYCICARSLHTRLCTVENIQINYFSLLEQGNQLLFDHISKNFHNVAGSNLIHAFREDDCWSEICQILLRNPWFECCTINTGI